MTYAASGSSGITVADNDNIDFGTGDFTLAWKGSLPDWTPAYNPLFFYKAQESASERYRYSFGFAAAHKTLHMTIGRGGTNSDFIATTVPDLADGTTHLCVAVVTRETALVDGSIAFYVDGVQLGVSKTITATAPGTVSGNTNLYISGSSTTRFASTNEFAILFNRALTAAEVLDLYNNGVAEADKWGSQTPTCTSDFSAGAYNWDHNIGDSNLQVTGNNDAVSDGVTSYDDCLKVYANGAQKAFQISKGSGSEYTLVQYDNYRLTFKYLAEAGCGIAYFGTTTNGQPLQDFSRPAVVEGVWTEATIEFTNNARTYLSINGFSSSSTIYVTNLTANKSIYFRDIVYTKIGATLALEPEGVQTDKWYDSSTNDLDASYPATGYSIYPDGTGVRIASTANGSAYNFSSIEDGFSASGVHTIKIYDYLEMRFTEPPTWNWVDGYYEVALPLEILK
jgi:hypothetical protein